MPKGKEEQYYDWPTNDARGRYEEGGKTKKKDPHRIGVSGADMQTDEEKEWSKKKPHAFTKIGGKYWEDMTREEKNAYRNRMKKEHDEKHKK